MSPAQILWARCRGWIEAATLQGPGLESITDVEQRIAAGQYSFWPGANCAAVCEIRHYDNKKALVVVHGGGDLRELLEKIEPMLCAYARAQGCDVMMGEGRKGWERAARDNGYRFGMITMMKNLEH
jgi:hypothetical protein